MSTSSRSSPIKRKMIEKAILNIAILLSICGVCPPSATSDRLPRCLDTLNTLLRLALLAGYCYSNLLEPSIIKQLASAKIYKVLKKIHPLSFCSSNNLFLQKISLYLARLALVAHNLFAMSFSPTVGRCISHISHLKLKSFAPLIPALAQVFFLIAYPIIWKNPFSSLAAFPYLFLYLTLSGCIVFVSLQTILIEIFMKKVIFLFICLFFVSFVKLW